MPKYNLQGSVVPKARPRFSKGFAYLPERYRTWKTNAIAALIRQRGTTEPMTRAEVLIELHGSHNGDLDNLSGSLLDALVQAEILSDDRISVVSKLTVTHRQAAASSASILITQPPGRTDRELSQQFNIPYRSIGNYHRQVTAGKSVECPVMGWVWSQEDGLWFRAYAANNTS